MVSERYVVVPITVHSCGRKLEAWTLLKDGVEHAGEIWYKRMDADRACYERNRYVEDGNCKVQRVVLNPNGMYTKIL
jgi:hypothetical protein